MHHGNDATSTTKGIVEPDSQDKLKMPRFSGGTYSKPEPKMKLIPPEEVTYLQHRKPYGRTAGSSGPQKRHCRRSITPPPSSRRVSLLGSRSLAQNPMPSASSYDSPRKRLQTAENRDPCAGGHISSSATPCISSLKNFSPPSSSQPSSTNFNTDAIPRNLDGMVGTQALARSSSSSILRSQGQKSEKVSASLPKEGPSMKSVLLTPTSVHGESSTECQKVPSKHSLQSIASAQYGALSQERNSGASISHGKSLESRHNMDILETGAPLILHTKLSKKHYQSEACWKGNFHVTGGLIHTCDGLEAHFPLEISVRVYEASNQMPEILNLEAVPLSQLWPKSFKMVPPDSKDIGLWFVSSHQRPHWSLDQLLEKVCSHTGLFTKIGDTELAVFSSKLLTPQDQRENGQLYFWGVFGKHIRKKPRQTNNHIKNVEISNPCQPNDSCNKYEEVGMKLDVTKGKAKGSAKSDVGITLGANRGNPTDVTGNRETVGDNYEGIAKVLDLTGGEDSDRVNDCMAVLGASVSKPASCCSVPAPSFLNGCCHHDSEKKGTSISEDSSCQPADRPLVSPDLMLDIPPGFTKAHCQLQTGTAALSYADVTTSLVLDIPPGFPTNIPPGFTEAHRRLPPAISPAGPACVSTPGTEKRPFVRFSLNVPRPVKMGAPLGFTPLHAVKKEPGLPAADESETTDAVVKPGKGEVKIADNEVKIEQDVNSEEREVPKIRRLSDLY